MAAAAIEGTGGGVATAGPGVARRLRGSVGRGDSLDVLYSATTVTTGRSLRKRFVSMRRAAPLHACPPHPLAVWSACVLLISNSVFIVYVHSAPQSAKTLDLERVERFRMPCVAPTLWVWRVMWVSTIDVCVGVRELLRFLSLHSSAHTSSHATRESREVVAQNPLACAALSRSRSRARIAYLSTL